MGITLMALALGQAGIGARLAGVRPIETTSRPPSPFVSLIAVVVVIAVRPGWNTLSSRSLPDRAARGPAGGRSGAHLRHPQHAVVGGLFPAGAACPGGRRHPQHHVPGRRDPGGDGLLGALTLWRGSRPGDATGARASTRPTRSRERRAQHRGAHRPMTSRVLAAGLIIGSALVAWLVIASALAAGCCKRSSASRCFTSATWPSKVGA